MHFVGAQPVTGINEQPLSLCWGNLTPQQAGISCLYSSPMVEVGLLVSGVLWKNRGFVFQHIPSPSPFTALWLLTRILFFCRPQLAWPRMLAVNGQVFLLPPPPEKLNPCTAQSAPEHTEGQHAQEGRERDGITARQHKDLNNQQQKEKFRSSTGPVWRQRMQKLQKGKGRKRWILVLLLSSVLLLGSKLHQKLRLIKTVAIHVI